MASKNFRMYASGKTFNLETFQTIEGRLVDIERTIVFESKDEFVRLMKAQLEKFFALVYPKAENTPDLFIEYKGERIKIAFIPKDASAYVLNTQMATIVTMIIELVANTEKEILTRAMADRMAAKCDPYENMPTQLQR